MAIFDLVTGRQQLPDSRVAEAVRDGLAVRAARPAPYNARRAVTAAASVVKDSDHKNLSAKPYVEWQNTAWAHYERIGEVHFGFTLLSNIFSRIRLYGASITNANEVPVPLSELSDDSEIASDLARATEELMEDLSSKSIGSRILRPFALNQAVAGECYLINLKEEGGWHIKSTSEVSLVERGYEYKGARSGQVKVLPKNTYVARIWQQHPRWSKEPDSSMVGVADSCEELLMLSRLTRSATRSRLNAGLLFMPDGISVAAAQEPSADDILSGDDTVSDQGTSFVADLIESMVSPISDESSVASVVPMVVTGPTEQGKEIKHILFTRDSDEWLVTRADRALERVLQGIDLPKDVVQGLANVKYMNAVVIDENLYKAHIEPMAIALADALTEIYLRPLLKARGVAEDDYMRVGVWYDPTEVVVRPNRSDDATTGVTNFMLSPTAWRRESGFAETDAPTEEELAVMLALNKGQIPPDIASALFQTALPKVLGGAREEALKGQPVDTPDSVQEVLGQSQQPEGPVQ